MNRVLSGPDLSTGAESLAGHTRRLGPIPVTNKSFINVLAHTGLTGRGGAAFPVAMKWEAVAKHSKGDAVVLMNGAEGEPRSLKDRALMSTRPHLVLDGAFIAARVFRARRVVLYVGERHAVARDAMLRALAERSDDERRLVTAVTAPAKYVAGQEGAAIHMINQGVATPTTTPPLPFERGIGGAPTLVQNVETLAHVALIARSGTDTGTSLITLAGSIAQPGVLEVEVGTTIAEAVSRAGGPKQVPRAVLVGGYFGSWVDASDASDLELEPLALKARGLGLGCGVIGILSATACPVCETAGIMRYLAGESSAQCGPCYFGLRALADACTRIAERGTDQADLKRLQRWAAEVTGRGACRHPDGAMIFLQSALHTFAGEFANHVPHTVKKAMVAA